MKDGRESRKTPHGWKGVAAICLLQALCLSVGNAFQTFTENVNPFNRFLNPVDGVDLYSGNAAFTKAVHTVKGRNGLDIGINPTYSSNVYVNARSRNDVAPTGWLGLGWNLSYGSIRCEHKGTRTPADDDFVWISPQGHSRRLFVEFALDAANAPTGMVKAAIEEEPYIKVICDFDPASGLVKGWRLKKTDGTTLKYGNLGFTDGREATRFTFSAGISVEPLMNTDSPVLYPYEWDLSEIEDEFGNTVKFKYEQVKEAVSAYKWDAPTVKLTSQGQYTKESHLATIINPEGKRIVFSTKAKNPGEYYDPHKFFPEPDAFIEKFDSRLLDRVEVFNTKNVKVREFRFAYQRINSLPPIGGKNYDKSLLTSIKEFAVENGTVLHVFNEDEFSYYDGFNKANDAHGEYDRDYNYGAMKTHRDMRGFYVEYEYERKELSQTKTMTKPIDLPEGLFTYTWSLLDYKMGRTSRGNYPFAVAATHNKAFVFTWNGAAWVEEALDLPAEMKEGTALVAPVPGTAPLLPDSGITIVAGTDFFVLLGGDNGKLSADGNSVVKYFCVYNWNEFQEKWEKDLNFPGAGPNGLVTVTDFMNGGWNFVNGNVSHISIFGANGYFGVLMGNYSEASPGTCPSAVCQNAKVTIWNRFGSGSPKWIKSNIDNLALAKAHNFHAFAIPASSRLALAYSFSQPGYRVFNWDGKAWQEEANSFGNIFSRKSIEMDDLTFKDFGAAPLTSTSFQDHLRIYNWDGFSLKPTYYANSNQEIFLPGNQGRPQNKAMHFQEWIRRGTTGSNYDLRFRTWNGSAWIRSVNFDAPWLYTTSNMVLCQERDYTVFKELNGRDDPNERLRIPRWDNEKSEWDGVNFSALPIPPSLARRDPAAISYQPYCYGAGDYFLTRTTEQKNNGSGNIPPGPLFKESKTELFQWNGLEWKGPQSFGKPWGAITNNSWDKVADVLTQEDAFLLLHTNRNSSQFGNPALSLNYKFQNSVADQIHAYVIRKRTFKPGFGQAAEPIAYQYGNLCPTSPLPSGLTVCREGGSYDTRQGTAKFNHVTVTLANQARKEYFFHNGTDGNPAHLKLDGKVYKVENYDAVGHLIPSGELKEYTTYRNNVWVPEAYDIRAVKETVVLDRVNTVIETKHTLNAGAEDVNGQPRYSQLKNSDGRTITEYSLFAFEVPEYANMKADANMISQPGLRLVLENHSIAAAPASAWYNSVSKQAIRSASAVTWANDHNPSGVWAPRRIYSWEADKGADQNPTLDFPGFNFANPDANAANKWKLGKGITAYDRFGQEIEAERTGATGSDRIYSARFYRGDIAQPLADVVNARRNECAFFTGDYDVGDPNQPGYFDFENRWEKGGGVLTKEIAHFGQSSVTVDNAFGPTINVVFSPSKDYVFSAWIGRVGAAAKGFARMAVEFHSASPAGASTLLGTWDKVITDLAPGWNLYEHVLKSSELASHLTSGTPAQISHVRIWIGKGGADPETRLNLDDIRFHPSGALASTTYYDALWELPMVQVDANNESDAKIPTHLHVPSKAELIGFNASPFSPPNGGNDLSKKNMQANDKASLNPVGSIANFVGSIGFHPSDAQKINIYHDEIWEKPKVFLQDDPNGRIQFDKFGRPEKWLKMAHNAADILVLEKERQFSGKLHRVKLDHAEKNLVSLMNLKGDDVFFDGTQVAISCAPTFVDNSIPANPVTYSFVGWKLLDACPGCLANPTANTTTVTLPGRDIEIRPEYAIQ